MANETLAHGSLQRRKCLALGAVGVIRQLSIYVLRTSQLPFESYERQPAQRRCKHARGIGVACFKFQLACSLAAESAGHQAFLNIKSTNNRCKQGGYKHNEYAQAEGENHKVHLSVAEAA